MKDSAIETSTTQTIRFVYSSIFGGAAALLYLLLAISFAEYFLHVAKNIKLQSAFFNILAVVVCVWLGVLLLVRLWKLRRLFRDTQCPACLSPWCKWDILRQKIDNFRSLIWCCILGFVLITGLRGAPWNKWFCFFLGAITAFKAIEDALLADREHRGSYQFWAVMEFIVAMLMFALAARLF